MDNVLCVWETVEGKLHAVADNFNIIKETALKLSKAQRRVAVIYNGRVLFRGGKQHQ